MNPRVRRTQALLLTIAILAGSGIAFAQSPSAPDTISLLYGVTGGPGRRTTDGTFTKTRLPPGASQVSTDRTTTTLSLEAGVGVGRRLALLGIWDQTFGGNDATGRWGATSGSAVVRVWSTRRVWLEGGGGFSELGYKAPSGPNRITRFWAPGIAAGVGGEVLKGRRVSVTALARYTRGTFHGLTINSLSFQMGLLGRE